MNATQMYYHGEEDFVYRTGVDRSADRGGSNRPSRARRSRHEARRRGKAPSQYNGIHRRRKKRITW